MELGLLVEMGVVPDLICIFINSLSGLRCKDQVWTNDKNDKFISLTTRQVKVPGNQTDKAQSGS